MSVNYQPVVAELAAAHPEAWRNAHTGNAQTEDFIRLLAAHLHALDPNVGLNGKRGNENDISDDALAVFDPAGDVTDRTGRRMLIIDCIVGAGGPNPSPGWASVGGPSPGAWVQPSGATPPPPGPTPGATWEAKHAAKLAAFPAQHSPDARFVQRVAEQFAFSFPSEGWGCKAKDAMSPPSNNVMARKTSSSFTGYLIAPSTGPRTEYNLNGQRFISVAPVDHLGGGVQPPGPTPPPPPPTPPIPAPVPYPGDPVGAELGQMIFRVYGKHGEAPNAGMMIHAFRTAYDILVGGMTPAAAIAKRERELG